jgi:lipopolysaccharide export system protein LptA
MIRDALIGLLALGLALSAAAAAAAADSPLGNSDGPISISADRMTSDDNSRIVTFSGRVITRQDDLIITCDLMRVHYQPAGGQPESPGPAEAADLSRDLGGQPAPSPAAPPLPPSVAPEAPTASAGASPLEGGQEIHRIDCEGSVKIQQRDRLAVGQKALYLAKSEPRRLILTGDARIWEAGNSVTGHQVIYYLDQNRSQVESRQNQRVRAFYDEGGRSK